MCEDVLVGLLHVSTRAPPSPQVLVPSASRQSFGRSVDAWLCSLSVGENQSHGFRYVHRRAGKGRMGQNGRLVSDDRWSKFQCGASCVCHSFKGLRLPFIYVRKVMEEGWKSQKRGLGFLYVKGEDQQASDTKHDKARPGDIESSCFWSQGACTLLLMQKLKERKQARLTALKHMFTSFPRVRQSP